MDPNPCTCGRPWTRLAGGILGRVDDMVIVRGNNLYPAAMEELMRGLPEVGEYRCTVRANGPMNSLEVEIEPAPERRLRGPSLAARVAQAIHDRFHFRAKVATVASGSLPRSEFKSRRFVRA